MDCLIIAVMICFTLRFKCVYLLNACGYIYWTVKVVLLKKSVYNWLQRALKALGKQKGVLQIGIRAKVSTLSLDGPVERSLDRECEGKLGLEWPISDPGLLRSVKEILDEFLSSGGLAVQ
jgi:hypothetical protein